MDAIHVLGYPAHVGGASTELWHTVRLWRRAGLDVTLTPTWKVAEEWFHRLASIGAKTHIQEPAKLSFAPGSIVVAFCNSVFLAYADKLTHCRTVWVPCMTYMTDMEKKYYAAGHPPFSAYVYQSVYQHRVLGAPLRANGVSPEHDHLIPGAFDVSEIPYRPVPHANGDPFVVGRLSRSDPRKFSPETWRIYGAVPNVRARVMGWEDTLRGELGRPPHWAEVLSKGAESTETFLRSLHAMVHAGGEARENWPRVGLEAMAAGVPIVTDNNGGWPEMIEHGRTGYLCDTSEDFMRWTCRLAEDNAMRLEMTSRARTVLENELADPDMIWAGWQNLFEGLDG